MNRDGFGIHPKGSVPELLGCLVLSATAAKSFWSKWKVTLKADLPKILKVKARELASAPKAKTKKQTRFKYTRTTVTKKAKRK